MKADVDLDTIYGVGTVQLHAPMRALVLLAWRFDGSGFSAHRLTVPEALA